MFESALTRGIGALLGATIAAFFLSQQITVALEAANQAIRLALP